jgi:hypothetical protein
MNAGADPSFVGPESLRNFRGPLQEKEHKITKIQLGTKVNINLE